MRLVLLICLLLDLSYAQRTINLSTARNSKMHEISALVVTEAYERAGIELHVHVLPTADLLQIANAGIVDGEISRALHVHDTYGNLLRVPVEVNHVLGVAFARDKSIVLEGWKSLKKYRIAIIKGCDFSRNNTRNMRVTIFNNESDAFKALKKGKVDLVVLPLVDGLQTIRTEGISGVYVLKPVLIHIPLYHYIHKRNQDLGPLLTKILREMKREGRIKEIRKNYLQKWMPYSKSPMHWYLEK